MMSFYRKLSLCIIFAFVSINCSAQVKSPAPTAAELEVEIKAIENGLLPPTQIEGEEIVQYNMLDRMKHYNIPGLSIAVVIDGKIRWTKGYGISNSKTGKKVNKETVFQAASISKPVSALGTLKLVEEGKLDLDENVNTYLKDWKVTNNQFTKKEKVTLRRILSHNAGVTVHGFAGYPQSKSLPSTTEILEGKGQSPVIKVDAEPGTIYRYSGGGYTIIDKVIADVTGVPLEDYVNENILKAIGMTNSTFSKSLGEPYSNKAAAGFNRNGKMMDGLWHNYPMLAAASLWTTPTDLAKYCIEVQEIFDGKTDGVLSQKMVKEMLTDQVDGRGHGLGPFVSSKVPFSSYDHGGGNDGFRCYMRAFLKKNVAVIIMTNSDNSVGLIY
jgi:CubicO group peptidase (beta-lactamase class C family)